MALDIALLHEAAGFLQSVEARAGRLELPRERTRPVLLPTYRGTRRLPNLTALIALLLKRYGVPVLMHGAPEASHGAFPAAVAGDAGSTTSTASVLRELGIEPAASRADARVRLLRDGIAYAPIDVLAPGLADFAARRAQAFGRSPLPVFAALLDPFGGEGYRVIGLAADDELAAVRACLVETRGSALLFLGGEGEPFVDPRRQPRLEHIAAGVASICAEPEPDDPLDPRSLPAGVDAPSTAAWITRALAGSVPLPTPIVTQLACCLNGARRLTAAA